MKEKRNYGPIEQKILLTLLTGAILLLNPQSKHSWKIINAAAKEWKGINKRGLCNATKRLHQSKLVKNKKNADGTFTITLNELGKTKALVFNLDTITLKKPEKWDGLWRIVLFDIPEDKKKGMDALAGRLKKLGFVTLQKSVFVHPYECADEINFITELFKIRPYVRIIRSQDIGNASDLKKRFELS
mgnify:CR=1 FL=1